MFKLYKRSYNARRWIKLGVLPSFLPIVLVILYDTYLGYTFKNIINRHLLDFLLIIFALCVSVFSSAMILYKGTKLKEKVEKVENHILLSITIGLFCSVFFTLLYDEISPEDNFSWKKIIFCLVQILMTFLIIYKGMRTEEELELLSETDLSLNNTQPEREN